MSELIFPAVYLLVFPVCSVLIWKYAMETYPYCKTLLSFHVPIQNCELVVDVEIPLIHNGIIPSLGRLLFNRT